MLDDLDNKEVIDKIQQMKDIMELYVSKSDDRNQEYLYGSGLDIDLIKSLEKYLDSNDKGLLMEAKEELGMLESKRHCEDTHNVVGEVIEGDYVSLIEKLRAGVCDDIALIPSDSLKDTVDIIQYKDRKYGEKIREYHLTKRGFQMNIMHFWDED